MKQKKIKFGTKNLQANERNRIFCNFYSPRKEENNIKDLIKSYGADTTLNEVLNKIIEKSEYRFLPYKCPKCDGRGYITKEYNAYPSGLPDSGWVYEAAYDYSVCDLCRGKGWTQEEYKPKTETKIVGYEKAN